MLSLSASVAWTVNTTVFTAVSLKTQTDTEALEAAGVEFLL